MADDKSMPDTNTHEGLGAMSEEQIKEMEGIVRDTDHPYKDPITGKMNVDVPEDKLGVSKNTTRRRMPTVRRGWWTRKRN